MELKYGWVEDSDGNIASSNRTFMELKCGKHEDNFALDKEF